MFIAINILPSTEVHAKKKYYFNSYMTGFNTDEACSSLSDMVMLTRIIHAEEDFTAGYYNPYCVPMHVHGGPLFWEVII